MAESNGKPIDAKLFWRTLGQRAIGSTIVTAQSGEGPAGFLGLSASHVSADPPLMLASIDRRTSALATVLTAGHFAVNFLPRNASAIADLFGGKGTLKARRASKRGPGRRSSPAPRCSRARSARWTASSKRPSSALAPASSSGASSMS
jgi:flavin reductase (DIM6/NTAB) family NADH-FMN oxidoreductase RutF